MTDPKQAKQCAELLQAIAEPNRIRIIECLRTGSKNVTELAKLLNVEIVNVSHHLGVLRQAGLVQDEKHGRFVVYSLHPKIFNNDNSKAFRLCYRRGNAGKLGIGVNQVCRNVTGIAGDGESRADVREYT